MPLLNLPEAEITGSRVTGMVQDNTGYIWSAIEKALHRFDGYALTTYKPDPRDPEALAYGDLLSIYADNDNNLWVARYHGIFRRDLKKQRFEVMRKFQALRFPNFTEDSQGRVWHVNDEYPYYFDREAEALQAFDLYQVFIGKDFYRPTVIYL